MLPRDRIEFYYAFYDRIQLVICSIVKNIEEIILSGAAVGVVG